MTMSATNMIPRIKKLNEVYCGKGRFCTNAVLIYPSLLSTRF